VSHAVENSFIDVTEEGSESAATRGSLIHNLFFRFYLSIFFSTFSRQITPCVLGSKAQDGTQGSKGQDGRTIADTAEFVADHPFLFYLADYKFNDPQTETGDETVLDKKLSYAVVLMSGQLTSI
jgi:hypothetical protein